MTSIQPVKAKLSTGKKIAIATGAAAVGVAALAYIKGRQSDAFVLAQDAVKNGVEGAKKLNILETFKEGGKDLWQVVQLGIAKVRAKLILGAPSGKDVDKLKELEVREAFASGTAAEIREKTVSVREAIKDKLAQRAEKATQQA